MTTSGMQLSVATWRPVTVLIMPGPEPAMTTPGFFLM
jgi:hypothetical protein